MMSFTDRNASKRKSHEVNSPRRGSSFEKRITFHTVSLSNFIIEANQFPMKANGAIISGNQVIEYVVLIMLSSTLIPKHTVREILLFFRACYQIDDKNQGVIFHRTL